MILGIDIGGTKTAVALADAEGRVLSSARFPTDIHSPEATLSQAVDQLNGLDAIIATGSDNTARYFGTGSGISLILSGRTGLRWRYLQVRNPKISCIGWPMMFFCILVWVAGTCPSYISRLV